MNVTDISIILPSYNTKDYTIMAYESLRRYYPNNEIIILDDGSTDGSNEMFEVWKKQIPWGREGGRIIYWRNISGNIEGHTHTYNVGIKMATKPLVSIFHSDMVCYENYLENMLKYWKPKTVVCATRIEPEGIYPSGKEKILKPFGLYPSEFKWKEFEEFCKQEQKDNRDVVTKGIFAPWLISKEDYLTTGGMDELHYSPYPEEDGDWFLRLAIGGYDLIQSRDALCWHWISRGHRSWAKNGVGKDDNMFQFYQMRSRRNYLRKWHSWMRFDEWHYPIVPKVYDIALVVRDVTIPEFIHAIEPWCSVIFVDNPVVAAKYMAAEQPATKLTLYHRVQTGGYAFVNPHLIKNDVILEFSQKAFMEHANENLSIIHNLSVIIKDSAEPNCEMQLGIFKLTTHSLTDLAPTMVKVTNP